jgi:dipeptide transport system substrate-binding protein
MRVRNMVALALFLGLGARAEAAGTLVVCTEANPDALNSQLSTANTAFDVTEQTSDRLVGMKTGGSDLVPALAESWSISEDGLIYTFKLRHDVKWQSNAKFKPSRDFNADDVVFSFQRMIDPQNPFNKSVNGYFPMYADLLSDPVKAVKKTADDTVVFELKHPFAPLLSTLTMQPMSIVSAEYAAQLEKSGDLHDLDTNPIGTGPFSLVNYQKDTMIRFRAFPDFWGIKAGSDRAPKVDTLLFLITPDASARFAKLRANECQLARYPNPTDLPAMRTDPDLVVQDATIAAMDYITFKADKPPLDDKRVRQALAQAINLDDLVKVVYQGNGTPTAAMVPPTLFGHDANVQPRKYDPEAAKKLLAEAGHAGGGFKVDLWAIPVVRAYMPNGKRAAEMIQADWAKIGVQANIVTFEWGEYLKRARAGEGDVVMLGGTWDYPDPSEQLLRFTCEAIKTGGNSSHWCNQAYSDAVNKANLTTDLAVRSKLYIAAQEAFHDDVAGVLFADPKVSVPMRKNVSGFKLHFLGGQPFGGVSVGQ